MAGFKPEQPPQVRSGQTARAVFLGGECLKRAAREVGAIGGEAGGDVVGEGDGQVQGRSLAGRRAAINSAMIKDVTMGDMSGSIRLSATGHPWLGRRLAWFRAANGLPQGSASRPHRHQGEI